MTDTELKQKIANTIYEECGTDWDEVYRATDKVMALLQQSNREYADKLIGKDELEDYDNMEQGELFVVIRRNALRAELRKKNTG